MKQRTYPPLWGLALVISVLFFCFGTRTEAANSRVLVGSSIQLYDTSNYTNTTSRTWWVSAADSKYIRYTRDNSRTCTVTGLQPGTALVHCQVLYQVYHPGYYYLGTWIDGYYEPKTADLSWYVEVISNQRLNIVFQAEGGTSSQGSASLTQGASLGTLPTASRRGYLFEGWYPSPSGGFPVTAHTPVSSDTTLYAHWKKVSPPKLKFASLQAGYRKLSLSLKTHPAIDGWEIRYSTAKAMKSFKTKTVNGDQSSATLSGLKPGKTYFVRIRAFQRDSTGKKVYGPFSAKKKKGLPRAALSQTSLTLLKGKQQKLKLQGVNSGVRWSSGKPKVASVSKKGVVKAKSKGTAVITAKKGRKKYTCKVRVEAPKLNFSQLNLIAGQAMSLKLTGTSQTVRWSSNQPSVADVSADGLVTAKAKGTARITASVPGGSFHCTVSVGVLALDAASLRINVGQSRQLRLSGASEKASWSSGNQQVASVTADGRVTAVAKGTTAITATVSGVSVSCQVTVEDVRISHTSEYLTVGDTLAISVTGTSASVSWQSSNPSVVRILENGRQALVQAAKAGSAVLTAQVNGQAFRCSIQAEEPAIRQESLSLRPGQSERLLLTGTSRTAVWSSSEPSVASVSADGTVTAISGGHTVITAVLGGHSYTCPVSVLGGPGSATDPLPASEACTLDYYSDDGTRLGSITQSMGVFYDWIQAFEAFGSRYPSYKPGYLYYEITITNHSPEEIYWHLEAYDGTASERLIPEGRNIQLGTRPEGTVAPGETVTFRDAPYFSNDTPGPITYRIPSGFHSSSGQVTYTWFTTA